MGGVPFRFALLLLLSFVYGFAQGPSPIEGRERKLFERYEAQLARAFELIRAEKGVPTLSRIRRRQDLDQLVCTAALNDANPRSFNFAGAAMYKTSDPVSVTEELKSSAEFNHAYTPPTSRYAVA